MQLQLSLRSKTNITCSTTLIRSDDDAMLFQRHFLCASIYYNVQRKYKIRMRMYKIREIENDYY